LTLTKDLFDQASVNGILSEMYSQDERKWNEIREIDIAIERVFNGEYGICEYCEEPIDIGRLKVLPYTRFCVSCAQQNERTGIPQFPNFRPNPNHIHPNRKSEIEV